MWLLKRIFSFAAPVLSRSLFSLLPARVALPGALEILAFHCSPACVRPCYIIKTLRPISATYFILFRCSPKIKVMWHGNMWWIEHICFYSRAALCLGRASGEAVGVRGASLGCRSSASLRGKAVAKLRQQRQQRNNGRQTTTTTTITKQYQQ